MDKNRKRLAALFTICFFVILINAAWRYIPRLPQFQPAPALSFKDSDIQRLVLTSGTKNQTLIRQNGTWVIPGKGMMFPADADKINSLLKTLHGITADTVVSRNKNKFPDFGIGKSKISVITKNRTYALFVGATSLGDNAYARLDSQDAVFDASNLGTVYLDTDYRNLRLPIVNNTGNVQSLQIEYDGETATLIKAGNTWHNGDGIPVADAAVYSYLQNLADLQAVDLLPRTAPPTGDILLTVTLKEKDTSKTVNFYPAGEQKIEADVAGAPYLYILSDVYVAALEKKGTDFTATVKP